MSSHWNAVAGGARTNGAATGNAERQWRGLIESAARPRTYLVAPSLDRAEGDAEAGAGACPDVSHSADARWVRKGRESTLGYKGFARSDEEGFIEKVHPTPANAGERPEFGAMIDGATAKRVLVDKACASRANRDKLAGRHRDGIMRKAVRFRPPRASEKRFNRLISKRGFRIEQCFGTMKRLFGLARARYFGSARTHAQIAMAAIAQNLLKAANKIILTAKPKALPVA